MQNSTRKPRRMAMKRPEPPWHDSSKKSCSASPGRAALICPRANLRDSTPCGGSPDRRTDGRARAGRGARCDGATKRRRDSEPGSSFRGRVAQSETDFPHGEGSPGDTKVRDRSCLTSRARTRNRTDRGRKVLIFVTARSGGFSSARKRLGKFWSGRAGTDSAVASLGL